MRRSWLTTTILLLAALPALAKQDIRLDPDYDPRIELRLVVRPATKVRALSRVDSRTISSLFSTELLRDYEIVDIDRFEQYLSDRRFTLDNAFTQKAESVVRDSARIDAIADVDIYLWEPGTPGLPLLGRKRGQIGALIRVMDPFTGRLYWSVNRVEGVSPGDEFLDRATDFFRDLAIDLDNRLQHERDLRNQADAAAGMMIAGLAGSPPMRGSRKFTGDLARERAFSPSMNKAELDFARRTRSARLDISSSEGGDEAIQGGGGILPPLFEGKYEDIENAPVDSTARMEKAPQGTMPGEVQTTGPPPLSSQFRLDDEHQQEKDAAKKNGAGR